MQKWIQHAEKPLGHSDYTEIITQICISNNFSPDFGKMSPENITGEESFRRTFRPRPFFVNNTVHLRYCKIKNEQHEYFVIQEPNLSHSTYFQIMYLEITQVPISYAKIKDYK